MVETFKDIQGDALVGTKITYSYTQLYQAIQAAACAFHQLGMKPGDRVAFSAPSDAALVIAFLASQKQGLVWIGLNRVLSATEKARVLSDAGASLLVVNQEIAAQMKPCMPEKTKLVLLGVEKVEPGLAEDCSELTWLRILGKNTGAEPPSIEIDPYALSALACTSGTTGQPKGVMHSQHNMMTFVAAGLGSGRGGVWSPSLRRTACTPLTILYGMVFCPLVALASKGAYICLDKFDAVSVANTVETHHVEMIGCAPKAIYDLLFHEDLKDRPLSSLKYAFAGGALVAEELKIAFHDRFGSELGEEYGLVDHPAH